VKEKGAEKSVGREEVLHGIKIVQVFFIRKKVSYDIPSVYPPDTRRVSWELRKKKSHRAFQKCNTTPKAYNFQVSVMSFVKPNDLFMTNKSLFKYTKNKTI
jgi:hypothetical protein